MPTNMFGRLWRRGLVPVLFVLMLALSASYTSAGGGACASCAAEPLSSARCQFPNGQTDYHLEANSVITAPAGATVKGDILVWNGTTWLPVYPANNDGTTGTTLHIVQQVDVKAPWGANITCDRTDESVWKELAEVGCSGGCNKVNVFIWSGGKLVEWHKWTKQELLTGAPASPTSIMTPAPSHLECDGNITINTSKVVKAGCLVSGDVAVRKLGLLSSLMGYTRLYDQNSTSGLLVIMDEDAEVFAPWGASLHPGENLDGVTNGMLLGGCGPNGCNSIYQVHWPSQNGTWVSAH